MIARSPRKETGSGSGCNESLSLLNYPRVFGCFPAECDGPDTRLEEHHRRSVSASCTPPSEQEWRLFMARGHLDLLHVLWVSPRLSGAEGDRIASGRRAVPWAYRRTDAVNQYIAHLWHARSHDPFVRGSRSSCTYIIAQLRLRLPWAVPAGAALPYLLSTSR